MKNNGDVAEGWLRKAESDLDAAEACIDSAKGLDAACFHCQQAAEKSLKAWLVAHDEDFPLTHNLTKLVALCAAREPRFNELTDDATVLIPFAVKGRYVADFWPSVDEARTALEQARRIYQFVRDHWS